MLMCCLIWKTGIRFKFGRWLANILEICVCPWSLLVTFCISWDFSIGWLVQKLICVNDFVFSPSFCSLFSPFHSDHLLSFPSQMCDDGVDVGRELELCWGPRVSVVWSGLLESWCLGWMSSVSFLWCWCRSLFGVGEFEGCSCFVFSVVLWCE